MTYLTPFMAALLCLLSVPSFADQYRVKMELDERSELNLRFATFEKAVEFVHQYAMVAETLPQRVALTKAGRQLDSMAKAMRFSQGIAGYDAKQTDLIARGCSNQICVSVHIEVEP